MMKTVFAALLSAAVSTAAFAQASTPPKPLEPLDLSRLSTLEVLGVGQALRQFGDYRTPQGEAVKVPFKFDGTTLMTFAINIRAADDAERAYREAYTKFEAQELGDVSALKPEEVAQKKQAVATSEAAIRMINRPAGALLARVKESELCTKLPPVAPCTVKNDIPPSLLAAILPIVDRGQ